MAKASDPHESAIYRAGCRLSAWVSDVAAHPYVQAGVIVFCGAWFILGLATDLLTAALSILAITLTQMVLNRQNERDADDHRRDLALHAKLDELIIASRKARNDVAGLDEREEKEIVIERRRIRAEADEGIRDNR